MRCSSFVVAAVFCAAGCSSGPTLTVVVRTDFAPTTEFTSVQTMLESAPPQVHVAASGDDWFHGVTVAKFSGIVLSSHDVRASLLDVSGRTVASRHVILTPAGDYTLVVELTRSCAAMHCPGAGGPSNATECLGSRCVDPHCGGTDSAACPPAECATASDCPTPVSSCAIASCDHGLCLYAANDLLCPMTAPLCDLARGCVTMITPLDAGPPDLGSPDLGPPDLGPPDLGPPDLGPPDMGDFCLGAADCVSADGCETGNCFANHCYRMAVADGTHCDAGAVCAATPPACRTGACMTIGVTMSCDDHDPCTDDRCQVFTMTCRHGLRTGGACTYGDAGCPGTCSTLGTCLPSGPGC